MRESAVLGIFFFKCTLKLRIFSYLHTLLRHNVLDEVVERPGPSARAPVPSRAGHRPEHAHVFVQQEPGQWQLEGAPCGVALATEGVVGAQSLLQQALGQKVAVVQRRGAAYRAVVGRHSPLACRALQ